MATINALDNNSSPFTVTSGNLTVSAGHAIITAGNIQLPTSNAAGTAGIISFAGADQIIAFSADANIWIGQSGSLAYTAGVGQFNSAVGAGSQTSITTGSVNEAFGINSLHSLTTGVHNAGYGTSTLGTLVSGNYNTAIGFSAGGNYNGSESSNISIGASTSGTLGESNCLRIGAGSGTGVGQLSTAFISGIAGVTVTNQNLVTINTSTGQLGSIIAASSSALLTAGGSLSSVGTVDYRAPSDNGASATESLVQIPLPVACTLSNLYVNVTANASTTNITVTVRKNGANTAITTTITALTTGAFTDTSHTASFAAGDLISYQISASTVGVVVGSIGLKLIG